MILYHINIGFPLLSPGSKFVSPSVKIAPRDSEAEEDIEKFNEVEMPPLSGYREKVYYHEMKADENGMVRCAVLAENASEEPYGLYVIYNKNQLPRFVQWKMLGEQNYVLGIEPSNCWTEGRDKEREWGTPIQNIGKSIYIRDNELKPQLKCLIYYAYHTTNRKE